MNILELLEIGSVWLQNKTAIQLLVFQPFVDVERPPVRTYHHKFVFFEWNKEFLLLKPRK
jgi:hypothetical protein